MSKHPVTKTIYEYVKACSAGLLLLLLVCSQPHRANATHAAGADLTYTCLGGLVYQVDATFFRDCGGSSEPGNVTITYKSGSCTFTRSVLANKILVNNGQEITLPCATSPSTCNGGVSTGVRKWVYRTIITLPYACADWVFSYRICCRNCTVTTIQSPCASNSEIYVEATLNNVLAPGNSSPEFNNMPVAFVCLGQNFNYNQGVFDVDGDSLSYELITPKISATAQVTWLPPATTQSPLASSTPFTINAITGDINFTPSAMQIGILAIRVNEFRNGILIGSTIRDMQVYTRSCFNSIPVASGIDSAGNYITTTCAGQPVCFTVTAQDADTTQIVTLSVYNPIVGSVITQTYGSRPTLQFCWTPSLADISRHPYIFTVTIRDDACPVNGVQTFSYTIFVSGPQANITATDPDCGSNNGSASVVVTNDPGCTYAWNTLPPQYTQSISGLAAGGYEVTVTNLEGCTGTFNAVLNSPVNTVEVSCTSTGIISCISGNVGTAQATASGGVLPYTFLWNTGAANPSLSGLAAGMYVVTVTDANGCKSTDSTIIPSAAGNLVTHVTVTNEISCYGANDGSVNVSASGGAVPYSYSWSNGATTPVINALAAGNYTVIVTDFNGCTSTTSIVINQPAAALSANFVSSAVSCRGGNNGTLNLFINGGTAPYAYNWNNGATTQNISGLASGNYSVTITDSHGCTVNYYATVTEPAAAVSASISVMQQVTCFGGDNGALDVTATGGTVPYSYEWNHGASTASVLNLEAGNYSVTVADANGCTFMVTESISQPLAPVLGLTTVSSVVSCFGGNNGALDLTVSGGTAPYTYLWNSGIIVQDLDSIPAGVYEVTITDANGCTISADGLITQPAQPISINLTAQQILCFNGNNGSITSTVTGGAATYSYQWNTGAITQGLSGLSAGTYTVTVTDGNSCTSEASLSITQPAAPLIPVISVSQPVNCSGEPQGIISLNVSGGTAPYTYLWNNGTTSQNAANLSAGTYTVTITDANGCNAIISETISEPGNILLAPVTAQNISCFGNSNGSLSVNVTGGTAPYTLLWNTGAQASGISGLPAGEYSVTVTDANGCSVIETASVSQPASAIMLLETITDADCMQGQPGSISLNVSGGTAGYSFLWNTGSVSQDQNSLQPGNYSVTVTDANGCTVSGNYEVTGNSEILLEATGATIICAGETVTLIIDSVPEGSYQWFYDGNPLNGATGLEFVTPAGGIYTVSVTNDCGTFVSNEIEVEVKSLGNVSVSNTQIICPPETAQLLATGGVTYEWTPPTYITFTTVPDPFVSPLTTTLYSVQITNEWGCKTSLKTEVAVVCDTLFVPTGFSPNSDGVNDGYVIDGIENYPDNRLWVYNRWGKLVFKAREYQNNWDGFGNIQGVSMGVKVPSGTYYYILDLNDGSKPRAGYLIIRG